MKFLCSNCKAKYQIADEKVAGRTLRMTCRRCQEEIVIRGEGQALTPAYAGASSQRLIAPAPAAPSPLGADFQMQLAQSVRASALPAADEWHVAINDVPVGPIRREDVARKLATGAIDLDSLAWREGMEDWMPIRQIPELAVLSVPPPPPLAAAPPPILPHAPLPRADLAPASHSMRGSAVPYDPWTQPQPDRPSQIMVNPVLEVGNERRALPSWPAMFAVACGFAFLMSALTIFGANWLKQSPEKPDAPAVAAAGAAAPQPAQPVLELPEEQAAAEPETPEMIIGADDPALARPSSSGTARPRNSDSSSGKSSKKQLTEAEKAMLARMQGDTGSTLSNLNTGSNSIGSRPRAGSLSSQAVSQVVQRGKKNLQRCYETALRSSGSTDTVRLDVELTVSPSGNVSKVKASGGGLPGMAACIERTVKMWRFPESGESSPVKFPLVFQPGA